MRHYFRRTTVIQIGLIGLLVGLWLAKTGYSTSHSLLLCSFIALPLLLRLKLLAIIAALFLGLNLGLWRGQAIYARLIQYERFRDQRVTLLARVDNDSVYSDRGQLEFQISRITELKSRTKLPGTIRVRGYQAPSVQRNDIVEISGKLREGFGSRQGFISFAQIKVVARNYSVLESIRARFLAGVFSTLPEPHASLGLGFLVGTRTLLPETLLVALSATGLTHIVAVSGYNLTILVRLTRRLFAKKSIYLSTMSSFMLIMGFVLVTGLSPSIARATVVSGLALIGWYYGRNIQPTILLLSAAAITGMLNPLYIWFDLGWYLSFAAFVGVLILGPLITKRWFKKRPKLLTQILIETTSAQLLTLPIIAVIFGEFSLISLLANLIILPLIPLAMITTFIAGVAGMVLPTLAGWVAWPATVLLTFIVDVVRLLAGVPWALRQVKLSWFSLWLIYSAIIVVIIGLRRNLKRPLDATQVIE
ncbi:MAG TPA: ComEC/Rec2 family competence protein [Candidatus Saccharimonadales bacterium]